MNLLTHFQIWLSSLIVAEILQTVQSQSSLQREEIVLLNLIILINAPEGVPHNLTYVELDDAPVASDNVSIADSYNFDEPVP